MQLATIGYVDAALTLFVAAGFYCLDRRQFALSGLFLGTAFSTKYLGGYFAAAALVIVVLRSPDRRRAAAVFAACCLAAALPTTLWLLIATHNPLFPFFGTSAWSIPLPAVPWQERVVRTLRLAWDVTFVRERVNAQPPITPFLIPMLVLVAARRHPFAIVAAGYVAIFAFLPQDSRYLVPLLPLLSIAAAMSVGGARWAGRGWVAALAVAPGVLYAAYALTVRGLPPLDREALLSKRIPEYSALTHAGKERVYVCGAEQLKYYAGGELLGDHNGPYAYDRVLAGAAGTSAIARNLQRIGAHYFLVAKRVCAPPRADGGMDLVFEDAGAQLWRVQRSQPSP